MPDRTIEISIEPRPVAAGVSVADHPAEGAAVEFRDVEVAYGKFVAVRNFSLAIRRGSFITLLGPSGCGKTTVLRAIAGLVDISRGQILIGGRRVDDVPIYTRNIGLVFQSYALFPHKTVFDNVAFGLKYRNVPKPEIVSRVKRALDMVRLPGSEKKLPAQLSGGQQQRIALARAIVFEPEVLLLDEPLSALDANMREEMRVEIKKIQKATGITAIFVTHDQEEALSMSDRIVVMNAGTIEQIGSPESVYETPQTEFVADFLGKANILPGTVSTADGKIASIALACGQTVRVAASRLLPSGSRVKVVLRPQKFSLDAGATNSLSGKIVSTSYLGGSVIYEVNVGNNTVIRASITGQPPRGSGEIAMGFEPTDCGLLDHSGTLIA
ncbi:MAG: ABC transporter ATP-binding protein [Parvibaculaceae bacterium]